MIVKTLAMVGIVSITGALASGTTNRTTLPYQLGPHPVHISNHELQTERDDPLAPTPMKRRLMVSIYQPLNGVTECPDPSTEPYMPNLTEQGTIALLNEAGFPNDTFSRLQVPQCASQPPSLDTNYESVPLLVFSHGATALRFIYQTVAASVASAGYTVISIDHTYDSRVVEFPGAQTVDDLVRNNYPPYLINATREENYEFFGEVMTPLRSDDATSVLDAVEAGEIPGLEHYSSSEGGLRAGIFGHSLGGATSASAIVRDGRFAGGFSLDGAVFRTDVQTDKPFVTMSSESTYVSDPLSINDTVAAHYEELSGYRRWVYVTGTAHNAYGDLNAIVDALDIRDDLSPEVIELNIGPILGPRIQEIMYSYAVDFFDMLLKGREERLLNGPSQDFDEVVFLRSDN